MNKRNRVQAIRPMIEAAFEASQVMSPAARADILEGISIAMKSLDPDMATKARLTCEAIREAEAAQLCFHHLIAAKPRA